MQAWGFAADLGRSTMCNAERAEVVQVAGSRDGTWHGVILRPNGTYQIRVGGATVSSLYWRAGELDRCVRALEQIIAGAEQTMPAAA